MERERRRREKKRWREPKQLSLKRSRFPSTVGDKISLADYKRKRAEYKVRGEQIEEYVASFETKTEANEREEFSNSRQNRDKRRMISGIGRVARHNVRSVPFDTAARYR